LGNNVNVSIRFYQPGDDENIVELLKKTFPKWAKFTDPLNLWRWKYINTPLRSIITVVVADNKIVGCLHSVIFNAKLGSEVAALSWEDDLAIDTDFRGLGLWQKMREPRDEEYANRIKYKYTTTTNPILKKSWVKRNLSLLPFPVTRMMKTKDISLLLQTRSMKNSLLVKVGYIFLTNLNWIINLFRSPIDPGDDFKIAEISEFDEGIDSFWDKIKDDYNFILEKKHEYLNWRFTDNDRGNHVKFQAVDGDEVLGYVVVGFKPGHSESQIVDLLALKNRLDVADALFGSACEYLEGLGMNTVYYQVVVGHPYQEISKRHRFIDSQSRPYIMFGYTDYWDKTGEVPFLKQTVPSQVYFNYSETV
jgi:hypothetical protein